MPEPILQVKDVVKHYPLTRGIIFKKEIGQVRAVDGVSFDLLPGETLGIVGESGCGKSTLARLVMKLEDPTSGEIWFEGEDMAHLGPKAMRAKRRDIQIVLQDPYTSLNPRMTVGDIVGEPFDIHPSVLPKGDRKKAVQDLLDVVGLNPEHINRYPHQFSGGQRQRIGIARGLALRPKIIVCDEPVSALDVSVQAQVINLFESLQNEFNLTYIFIAHDLSVVRHMCDRIAVMYLGKIVEVADAETVREALEPEVLAQRVERPRPSGRAAATPRSGSSAPAAGSKRASSPAPTPTSASRPPPHRSVAAVAITGVSDTAGTPGSSGERAVLAMPSTRSLFDLSCPAICGCSTSI